MKAVTAYFLRISLAATIVVGVASADVVFEVSYTDAATGGSLIDTTLYVDAVAQSAATCGGSATTCYLVDGLDAGYTSTGFDKIAYPGTGSFTPGSVIPAYATNSAWSDDYVDNLISVNAGGAYLNSGDGNNGLGYTDTTQLFPGGPDNAYFVYNGGAQYYEYQFAQSNTTGAGTPISLSLTVTELVGVPEPMSLLLLAIMLGCIGVVVLKFRRSAHLT